MVSLVFTQSQLLGKEVFLIDRIDLPQNRDFMKHLQCLIFIRPGSSQNMLHLENELTNPHYGSYYLCK